MISLIRKLFIWFFTLGVVAPTVPPPVPPPVQQPVVTELVQVPAVVVAPPVVRRRRRRTSTLWCNQKGDKYNDQKLNRNQWLYDKPAKRRHRDHLIVVGALFFAKRDRLWRLVGRVTKVEKTKNDHQLLLTVEPWGPLRDKEFKNKNDILEELGFEKISSQERMWGVIPVRAV